MNRQKRKDCIQTALAGHKPEQIEYSGAESTEPLLQPAAAQPEIPPIAETDSHQGRMIRLNRARRAKREAAAAQPAKPHPCSDEANEPQWPNLERQQAQPAKAAQPDAPEQRRTWLPKPPTLQDHISDLHDAATRFEDRAKRAEAELERVRQHAEALAAALRRTFAEYKKGKCEIDASVCIEARERLAAWDKAKD